MDERAQRLAEMRDDPAGDLVLDGSSVGGALAALLGADVTGMPGQCASCHTVHIVGTMRVYLRGPIGGYFVWEAALGGPLLLVAGGSGVVPLMAMARHRARSGMSIPTRLLFSSRTYDEIIYREELDRLAAAGDGFEVIHTLTRQQPDGWTGLSRRIDEAMLADALEPLGAAARAYACGPTALVEVVANALVRLGLPPDRIRTERFGPTGT